MSFQKQQMTQTVKWMNKNQDKLDFELTVQRKQVWKLDQKSLLIHSLIVGYPVPPFYTIDTGDDILHMLDGKQRGTTFISFVNDEFALSNNTPDVNEVEIAGLKFSELPEDFQDEILSYNLNIYRFRNITDEEIEEFFISLNSGTPLKPFELIRVIAGTEVMSFIEGIAKEPFFSESINITESGKNRFVDQEVLFQITALIINNGQPVSFSGKTLKQLAEALNKVGIEENKKEIIRNTTQYLNLAFPEKNKELKKVNVPMIFIMAIKAQNEGVNSEKFAEWAISFLNSQKPGSLYKSACNDGSAKKEKVADRLEIMTEAYSNTFMRQEAAITVE